MDMFVKHPAMVCVQESYLHENMFASLSPRNAYMSLYNTHAYRRHKENTTVQNIPVNKVIPLNRRMRKYCNKKLSVNPESKMKMELCWMPSSGMWRRVDILLTDVSEERIASIFSSCRLQVPAHAGSSLVDFLYPEDGGDTFIRNIG
jgi:hypothetical protein